MFIIFQIVDFVVYFYQSNFIIMKTCDVKVHLSRQQKMSTSNCHIVLFLSSLVGAKIIHHDKTISIL